MSVAGGRLVCVGGGGACNVLRLHLPAGFLLLAGQLPLSEHSSVPCARNDGRRTLQAPALHTPLTTTSTPPLPAAALLLCSYRTTIRVWDIKSVIDGTGAPVVTAVWDMNALAPSASGINAQGLMSVRWTGKASGSMAVGPDVRGA